MGDHLGVAIAAPPQAAPRRRLAVGRTASDERLAARVRAGDESAFEVIYDRYHRELLAFCRHMVGSREEAEDVLQHVMVAAHRQLVSGTQTVALRPWLYAVARNRSISVLRARREAASLEAVAEPTAEGLAVAARVEQREDLQAMLADLARLPDDQRAALLLAELGALSHDEIGEALGVRRDKVKALVFQAREALSGWRAARDADCAHIREELAVARGGVLRRAPLRRHLEVCQSCRAFSTEVKRQRAAMAMLLPVLPTVALKANVLGAASGSAAVGTGLGTVAAGGGAAATSAGGVAGGLTAKALTVVVIAGAAGGGYAVVDTVTGGGVDRAPILRQVGGHETAAAAAAAKPLRGVVILPERAVTAATRSSAARKGTPVVLVGGDQLSATWSPVPLVPPSAVLTVAPTAPVTPAGEAVSTTADGRPVPTGPGNNNGNGRQDPPANGVNGTAPGQTKADSSASGGQSTNDSGQGSGSANGNAGGNGSGQDSGSATSNSGGNGNGNGNGPSAKSNAGGSSSTKGNAGGNSENAGTPPANSNAGGNSDSAGTPPANSNAGGNSDTAGTPPANSKAGGAGKPVKAGTVTVVTGD